MKYNNYDNDNSDNHDETNEFFVLGRFEEAQVLASKSNNCIQGPICLWPALFKACESKTSLFRETARNTKWHFYPTHFIRPGQSIF